MKWNEIKYHESERDKFRGLNKKKDIGQNYNPHLPTLHCTNNYYLDILHVQLY